MLFLLLKSEFADVNANAHKKQGVILYGLVIQKQEGHVGVNPMGLSQNDEAAVLSRITVFEHNLSGAFSYVTLQKRHHPAARDELSRG